MWVTGKTMNKARQGFSALQGKKRRGSLIKAEAAYPGGMKILTTFGRFVYDNEIRFSSREQSVLNCCQSLSYVVCIFSIWVMLELW